MFVPVYAVIFILNSFKKRHYECPILLIEFEAGKPFALKALRVKTYQIKELMQKLVLTILHFPTVRILWSATSTDTAVMFGQLKDDQDEPVLSEAQAINAGTCKIRYEGNKDFSSGSASSATETQFVAPRR